MVEPSAQCLCRRYSVMALCVLGLQNIVAFSCGRGGDAQLFLLEIWCNGGQLVKLEVDIFSDIM